MSCGTCVKRKWAAESQGKLCNPRCWYEGCPYSEIMTDDLTVWRSFYSTLKTPTLVPAVPRMLRLGRATASDFDVIAMLDGVVAKYREEQAKKA